MNGVTLEDFLAQLTDKQRAEVTSRSDAMIAEIDGLKALRKLARLTQSTIAQSLEITQPTVSQIEKQSDLYLSTLRRFVEAAGGQLELIVRLEGHPPLRLSGFGILEEPDDASVDGEMEAA